MTKIVKKQENAIKLNRAKTPESVGVYSEEIKSFFDDCDKLGFNMHSAMIIKEDLVAAECHWAPFEADVPHAMFSFSKGVTGIAVGFAVCEGLLSLDDKLCKHFPYKTGNAKIDAYNECITIRHLITHRSGKKISAFVDNENNDWLEHFMSAPFLNEPGKKFDYTSENIYMLSRLVSLVSNQSLVDFLDDRLFKPLGIQKPFWETDHNGYAAGGWGAFFTPEDMAKISLCYLHNGQYNGVQVIPEKWIKLSTSRHIKKIPSVFNEDSGYGFQIFLQSEKMGTFSFNGLYSQFAVMFPKYNAVFVCTAGELREDAFMKNLWKHFPKAFSENKSEPENENALNILNDYIAKKSNAKPPKAKRESFMEQNITGKMISIKKKANAGILGPANLFMLSRKSGETDEFCFRFTEDKLFVDFSEKNSPRNSIEIGLNGEYAISDIQLTDLEVRVASWGTWINKNTLKLVIIPTNMAQYREFIFTFNENASVKVKSIAKPSFDDLFEFYVMFEGTKSNTFLRKICNILGAAAQLKLDPNFKGKIQ